MLCLFGVFLYILPCFKLFPLTDLNLSFFPKRVTNYPYVVTKPKSFPSSGLFKPAISFFSICQKALILFQVEQKAYWLL